MGVCPKCGKPFDQNFGVVDCTNPKCRARIVISVTGDLRVVEAEETPVGKAPPAPIAASVTAPPIAPKSQTTSVTLQATPAPKTMPILTPDFQSPQMDPIKIEPNKESESAFDSFLGTDSSFGGEGALAGMAEQAPSFPDIPSGDFQSQEHSEFDSSMLAGDVLAGEVSSDPMGNWSSNQTAEMLPEVQLTETEPFSTKAAIEPVQNLAPPGQDDVIEFSGHELTGTPLSYDLRIERIDTATLRNQVLTILADPLLGLSLMGRTIEIRSGILVLKNLDPAKASYLLHRIQTIAVLVTWRQVISADEVGSETGGAA